MEASDFQLTGSHRLAVKCLGLHANPFRDGCGKGYSQEVHDWINPTTNVPDSKNTQKAEIGFFRSFSFQMNCASGFGEVAFTLSFK